MRTTKQYSVLATTLATSVLGTFLGCAADLSAPPADSIDDYIRSLPYLPADEPLVEQSGIGAAASEGDYSCTSENLSETRQYDRIVAYGANTESLWPGALVGGDSVYTGLFSQMVFDRRPVTF